MNTLDIRTALVEQGLDDNSSQTDLTEAIFDLLCEEGHGYGFGYTADDVDFDETWAKAERLAARLWGNVEVA